MRQIYTVQIRSLAYVDVLLNPENGNTTMMNSHTVGKSVGVCIPKIPGFYKGFPIDNELLRINFHKTFICKSGLICLSVCHSLICLS